MKNYDIHMFKTKLSEIDWYQVINVEDVNLAWSSFCKLFLEVVEHVAPVRTVQLKQGSEPWFSGEILELIGRRDKAWYKFRKRNDKESYDVFKGLRNKTQSVIRKAKRDYIKIQIVENQNAPKSLWKTLKSWVHQQK